MIWGVSGYDPAKEANVADALWTEWDPYVGFLDNWFQFWNTQKVSAPGVTMEPVTGAAVSPTATVLGYRVAVMFKRYTITNGGTSWPAPDEDAAMVNIHFANYTGGALDATWTTGDFTSCETNLLAMFNSLKADLMPRHLIDSLRWYSYGPGVASGPPTRITPVGIAGTASGSCLPYQCATVLSLFTGLPRRRGRIYWPGLPVAGVTTDGQLIAAYVSTFATAWQTFLSAQHTAQIPVIVYDRVHGAIQSLTAGKVDSIVDIQRRRRPIVNARPPTTFPAS